MNYPIACPIQTTENFDMATCIQCRYFQQNLGNSTRAASCRKNRETQHKRNFEGLFWAYLAGINDRAIVEVAEEPKKTKT